MTAAPPLAGLSSYQEAARTDGSVEEAVRFLRRLARIEHRTLLVLAAHLNAVPEWEVKCALSLHIWQDAEHCAWLRGRVAELRKPPHYLDRPDDPALEAFFEELLRSRSTRELLTGVYHVLKPSVTAAIEEHVRHANPLAEQPTLRLLRFMLLEEREQLDWAGHALEALGGADAEWGGHLEAYLRAAGGASRGDERAAELPPPRGDQPLELVRTPRRDPRFTRLWNSRGRLPGYDAPSDEVRWRMLYVRLTEMHVPELLALTLYEWPGAPFEVHHDLARHLWDEARHAMMGEVAFETRGVDWQSVPHESRVRGVSEHDPRAARAVRAPLPRRAGGHGPKAGREAGAARGRCRLGRCVDDAFPGLRLGGRGPPRPPRAPCARPGVRQRG